MVQTNSLVRCATYLKTSKGKKKSQKLFHSVAQAGSWTPNLIANEINLPWISLFLWELKKVDFQGPEHWESKP